MFIPSGIAAAAGANQLESIDFNLTDNDPGTALVGVRFLPTGEFQTREGSASSYATVGTWLKWGNGADFEVRYTMTGDDTSPQAGNVWHKVNVPVTMEISDAAGGVKSNSGTMSIRQITFIQNGDGGSGTMLVDNT